MRAVVGVEVRQVVQDRAAPVGVDRRDRVLEEPAGEPAAAADRVHVGHAEAGVDRVGVSAQEVVRPDPRPVAGAAGAGLGRRLGARSAAASRPWSSGTPCTSRGPWWRSASCRRPTPGCTAACRRSGGSARGASCLPSTTTGTFGVWWTIGLAGGRAGGHGERRGGGDDRRGEDAADRVRGHVLELLGGWGMDERARSEGTGTGGLGAGEPRPMRNGSLSTGCRTRSVSTTSGVSMARKLRARPPSSRRGNPST